MAVTVMEIHREAGSTRAEVRPSTIVAFEDHFKIPLSEMKGMKQFYWLAWNAEFVAAKARGETVKIFEDWLKDVLDVQEVKDEDAPRPTAEAPSLD